MNKRQRQYRRALANGEIYVRPRKSPMPSPKIIQLKTRYRRKKRVEHDSEL